jgi:hypothetical protein
MCLSQPAGRSLFRLVSCDNGPVNLAEMARRCEEIRPARARLTPPARTPVLNPRRSPYSRECNEGLSISKSFSSGADCPVLAVEYLLAAAVRIVNSGDGLANQEAWRDKTLWKNLSPSLV